MQRSRLRRMFDPFEYPCCVTRRRVAQCLNQAPPTIKAQRSRGGKVS